MTRSLWLKFKHKFQAIVLQHAARRISLALSPYDNNKVGNIIDMDSGDCP